MVPRPAALFCSLAITADQLISRTHEDELPRQSGNEAPRWLLRANTRDTLYLVCEQGEAAAIPVHALPESESPADGTPLEKVSPLRESTPPALPSGHVSSAGAISNIQGVVCTSRC